MLLFTLAQASHTHGSLSVAKGHHALASDAGQGGTAPDQCPLCAGGVGFLAPDGSLPDLSAALVFSVGGRTSPTYIRELDLPFALSSRPPPLP